jgi:hypothetical protein
MCDWKPEFMICRERMQQNYRRTFSEHAVSYVGIVARDFTQENVWLHSQRFNHISGADNYGLVAR